MEKNAYEEILSAMLRKIKESKGGYYFSGWLVDDLGGKYTTRKVNYELKKAEAKGLLRRKSLKFGTEYRLPE